MRILNLMLGRYRGGIEQAVLDYDEALRLGGAEVLNVLRSGGWADAQARATGLAVRTISPMASWDPIATRKLRTIAREFKPHAVLCLGNRAISRALSSVRGEFPVVAIAQNQHIERFPRADACFAVTRELVGKIEALGVPKDRVFHMPNLTRLPPPRRNTSRRDPPVLGALGRFVAKKGFDVYLNALEILNSQGVAFRARLAGAGELERDLKALAERLGLGHCLEFVPWVDDKTAFYESLDVFVLPSHDEPFGIVLIEAMAHTLPCISTESSGPREILTSGRDGLLTRLGDAPAMAKAIRDVLDNSTLAQQLAHNARTTVESRYSPLVSGKRLLDAIASISRLAPTR